MPVKVNHLRQGVSHSQARLHLFYICEQKPFRYLVNAHVINWGRRGKKGPKTLGDRHAKWFAVSFQFLPNPFIIISWPTKSDLNNEMQKWAQSCKIWQKKQRHSSASASLNGRKLFRWRARLLASRLKERAKIQILQSNWIEHQLWPPPNWTYLKAV